MHSIFALFLGFFVLFWINTEKFCLKTARMKEKWYLGIKFLLIYTFSDQNHAKTQENGIIIKKIFA